MVGDTLKKASDSSGGQFIEIKDLGDAQYRFLTFPFPYFRNHKFFLSISNVKTVSW